MLKDVIGYCTEDFPWFGLHEGVENILRWLTFSGSAESC